jgi:hypothetical protein
MALSLARNTTKEQQLLSAYSYDPAEALPRLSEQEKQQFNRLPNELFQHLIVDRKSKLTSAISFYLGLHKYDLFSAPVMLKYEGPLVYANNMLMRLDNGGKGVPAPCFFCGEWLVDVFAHMKLKHKQEIQAKSSQTGAASVRP